MVKKIIKTADDIIDNKIHNFLNCVTSNESIDDKIEERFFKEIMLDKLLENSKSFYPKFQDLFFMEITRGFVSWNYTKSELINLYNKNDFIKVKVNERIEFFDEVNESSTDSLVEHTRVVLSDYLESTIKNNQLIYMKIATLLKLKSLNEYTSALFNQDVYIEDSLDINNIISSNIDKVLELVSDIYELKDCERLAVDNHKEIFKYNKN